MQTSLHSSLKDTPAGKQADAILRNCVHCGFCNATCPTYQLLGDELDGPRGRIYLIKQLMETAKSSKQTQQHLDRCLVCRNCETTCPSGVDYHRLLEIGRSLNEKHARRDILSIIVRKILRLVIPHRKRVQWLVKMAMLIRPVLPSSVKRMLPANNAIETSIVRKHERSIILAGGCVQDAFAADINEDCRQVLDQLSITAIHVEADTCCGALSQHLSVTHEARIFIKRNIDAWWPHIENGAEAIVNTASACGLMIKDYGRLLEDDAGYASKAARVSELCKDISEIIANEDLSRLHQPENSQVAFHSPCTLQHGHKITGVVEKILLKSGFTLANVNDSHLCCGSAGTYSILQPRLSKQLLHNTLVNLTADKPDVIVTANIGCLLQMRSTTDTPVLHWLQLLNPTREIAQ